MPPRSLLTQKDAVALALQAGADFPGCEMYLHPVMVPRPLTDTPLIVLGYVLIVAGPRGRQPFFECRSVAEYEQLYERVYAYYDEDAEPEDLDEDDGDDGASLPSLPLLPPVGLVGRSFQRGNGVS